MSQLHITSGYAARFAHQNYPIGQLRIPKPLYEMHIIKENIKV